MTTLLRRQASLGVSLAAGCAAGALLAGAAVAEPVVGQAAPGFTGVNSKGETVNLSDFADKTVVLEWTNHQCPYVKKHYTEKADFAAFTMQASQAAAGGDGVVWLQVISSAPGKQGHVEAAEADKVNADRGAAPAGAILDPSGEIGRLYAAKTTPHMFVIEKGTLVYAGGIDDKATSNPADLPDAVNYVRAALASVKAGEPVAVAQSKPYGCSVKYSS